MLGKLLNKLLNFDELSSAAGTVTPSAARVDLELPDQADQLSSAARTETHPAARGRSGGARSH